MKNIILIKQRGNKKICLLNDHANKREPHTLKSFMRSDLYYFLKYLIIYIVLIDQLSNLYVLLKMYKHPLCIYFFGDTIDVSSPYHLFFISRFHMVQMSLWIMPLYLTLVGYIRI